MKPDYVFFFFSSVMHKLLQKGIFTYLYKHQKNLQSLPAYSLYCDLSIVSKNFFPDVSGEPKSWFFVAIIHYFILSLSLEI